MTFLRRAGRRFALVAGSAAFVAAAPAARAQGGATGASAPSAPDVGQEAPDFTARGATRYGVLGEPVKLSDFRGKTVVLAFFFKARTKG